MDLRVLSVRQPWAGLLVTGVKRYEVLKRRQKTPGYLLIHASSAKQSLPAEMREREWYQKALAEAGMTDEKTWPRSALVGLVEFVDAFKPGGKLPTGFTRFDEDLCGGDIRGHFLWRAKRCWAFPQPMPLQGQLQPWKLDKRLHAGINAQLDAVGAPARVRLGEE